MLTFRKKTKGGGNDNQRGVCYGAHTEVAGLFNKGDLQG